MRPLWGVLVFSVTVALKSEIIVDSLSLQCLHLLDEPRTLHVKGTGLIAVMT